MPWSKVRQDKHGKFVRTNGRVYRPQLEFFEHYHPDRAVRTALKANARVWIYAVAQTPFCAVAHRPRIKRPMLWGSHGTYYDGTGKTINSELCWRPKEV